ncbi:MAG: hypothetical protein IJ894_16030 [Bacteroidales bacterium]|nr:hypothetical protein [Bacteroidales bacterium]
MKVYLPSFVRGLIRETAKYIKKEFGSKSEVKFLQEVKHTIKLLGVNPYIGSVELTVPNKTIIYRSIVVAKRNKIVYTTRDNIVDIFTFWDCRRNPKTLASQIEHNNQLADLQHQLAETKHQLTLAIKMLLSMGASPDLIAQNTGLSIDEINAL